VEATSLNPLDVIIIFCSIQLSRQHFCESVASKIKSKFFDLNLKFQTAHWDLKLLLHIKQKLIRLPITAIAPINT